MKKAILLLILFCLPIVGNPPVCIKVDGEIAATVDPALSPADVPTEIIPKNSAPLKVVVVPVPVFSKGDIPTALPMGIAGYKMEKFLGEGGMAQVFYVSLLEHLEKKYILKVSDGSDLQEEALTKEKDVYKKLFPDDSSIQWKTFHHPFEATPFHVLQLPAFLEGDKPAKSIRLQGLGAVMEPNNPYLVFVSSYHPESETEKKNLKLIADQTINLLLDKTQKLHESGIIHGDIKPDNTLIRIDKLGKPEILDIDWSNASIKGKGETAWKLAYEESAYGTPKYSDYESIAAHAPTERRDTFARGITIEEMLGHHLNAPQRLILKMGFASKIPHLKKFLAAAGELPTAKAYQEIAKNWVAEIKQMRSMAKGNDKVYYQNYEKFLIARLLDAGEGRIEVLKAVKEIEPQLIPIIKKQVLDMKKWGEEIQSVLKEYKDWRAKVIAFQNIAEPPPESPENHFKSSNPFRWRPEYFTHWIIQYESWVEKMGNSSVKKLAVKFPHDDFEPFFQVFPPTEESSQRLNGLIQELSGL